MMSEGDKSSGVERGKTRNTNGYIIIVKYFDQNAQLHGTTQDLFSVR